MKAIIYTSNTGYTQQYAELLKTETGLPAYNLVEARGKVSAKAEVIYMGWVMAGAVKGYVKASKRYNIRAVCAVGMALPTDKIIPQIKQRHHINSAEIFYLQGGFDMKKMRGMYKMMMQTMSNTLNSKLRSKPDKTEEEAEMLYMLNNACSRVSTENLSKVLSWYRANTIN